MTVGKPQPHRYVVVKPESQPTRQRSQPPPHRGSVPEEKRALFSPVEQQKLLRSAEPIRERPAIWVMMMLGVHPDNLIHFTPKNLQHDLQGWWLVFFRAKNARPRRELLPNDVGQELAAHLALRDRPRTRQGYWKMVARIAERAGFGSLRLSPMSLRHTAAVNFLREYVGHPDRLELVAARMGASKEVVIRNYIALDQWEKIR